MHKLGTVSNYKISINASSIEQTILYLQKKIYIAAQKCKVNDIIRIKDYLFSTREYCIPILKRIIQALQQRYYLTVHYVKKLFIYIYFIRCSNTNIHYQINYLVKHQIDQYLTFLLMRSDWTARLQNYTSETQSLYSIRQYSIYLKKKNVYSANYIVTHESEKLLFNKYLIHRLILIKEIEDKLCYWFMNQYPLNCTNSKHIYKNKLLELVKYIIHNLLNWHLYVSLQIKNIYQCLFPIDQQYTCIIILPYIFINLLDDCMIVYLDNTLIFCRTRKERIIAFEKVSGCLA